ncbi:MAG: Ppx/GppA family phosphatase, partial [Gammaproteobacteria bacterium]
PQARIRAVGTSALRRATNGETVAHALRARYGWPVDIISGTEEARLIYLGVTASLPESQSALVIDVGGGSTEFIFGHGKQPVTMTSVDVGCLTAAHQFFEDGELSPEKIESARYDIASQLMDVAHEFRWLPWEQVIGCSGCIEALLQINAALGHTPKILTPRHLDDIEALVLEYAHIDDLSLPGLEDERRFLVPAAIAIYGALFDLFAIRQFEYSSAALKDGVIQEMFDQSMLYETRRASVLRLARQHHVDVDRVAQIHERWQYLSLQMAQHWRISPEHQELAEHAIWLLDIGRSVSSHNYHQHSAYMLQHAELAGFDRTQQAQLAFLVAAQHGTIDTQWLSQYPIAAYPGLWQVVRLLRLAIILAKETNTVPELRLWLIDNTLHCACASASLSPWIKSLLTKECAYQRQLGWSVECQFDLPADKN